MKIVAPVFVPQILPADLILLKDGEIVSRQRVAEDTAIASDPVSGVFVTYDVPAGLLNVKFFGQPIRLRDPSGGFSEPFGSSDPSVGIGTLFDGNSMIALIPRQGRR